MAQWWLWCADGDEDIVATAVDNWLGWSLVSLQMLSAHAGFPSSPAPGLPFTLASALHTQRCGRCKDLMAFSRP